MRNLKKFAVLHTLLIAVLSIPLTAAADHPLFDFDEVMEITIPVDFKTLCRPREDEDCEYTQTTLKYADNHGEAGSIPIEIKVRGGWRSLTKNCSVPLLWIRFREDEVTGTPFAGQSVLPLTTHCGKGLSLANASVKVSQSDWEQYLLKEYLAQKMYTLFTDFSVRARLVRIEYLNPDSPRRTIRNFAFFTEHFDSVAARNESKRVERPCFDHKRLDMQAADRLALYQYMVGNTDWSIVRERNTVILETGDGSQVPMPYDFDMSGLVNTHYSGPAPGLPIEEVTERHYLGFCHSDLDWNSLFDEFRSRETVILQSLEKLPGLTRKTRKNTRKFLQGFFQILESEEERKEHIVNDCKAWPPSPIDHTSPALRK